MDRNRAKTVTVDDIASATEWSIRRSLAPVPKRNRINWLPNAPVTASISRAMALRSRTRLA